MFFFIVNPHASTGKGMKVWKKTSLLLEKKKISYRAFFTVKKGHATELAQKISSRKIPCTIVAVGGDGTANEVINGLINFPGLCFGYIPTGSGNDLARGLCLPSSPKKALDAILNPASIRRITVGCIDTRDAENTSAIFPGGSAGSKSNRKFIVSTGIGFDAAVCHEAMNSPIKTLLNHFHLGKLTYLGIALKQLLLMRPVSMSLSMNGNLPVTFSGCFFITAMNMKYEGGGFMFCPEADCEDNSLNIMVVEKMPKAKLLCLLPTAFHGKHVQFDGIHIYQCREAVITARRPSPVHTDGEACGHPVYLAVSLEKAPLSVITG